MEHRRATKSYVTTDDSATNHHQWKKRIAKQQHQLVSLALAKKPPAGSMSTSDRRVHQENRPVSGKSSSSWRRRWSKWFSPCGSERAVHLYAHPRTISSDKPSQAKSESDLSKRGSSDQDDASKPASTLAINPLVGEPPEKTLPKTSSHQHRHHHQSNDKVNNSNSVVYRDTSRRYSNTIFSSIRCGGGAGVEGQHHSRTSIAGIPPTSKPAHPHPSKSGAQHLSRSADRLNSKSSRRELRYEEHNDYIPPPLPLNSIQCHPTIDHYARALNQSSYFYSSHRRSQIEVYQLSSTHNRLILPRPYSTNFPLSSKNTPTNIPITYSSTVDNLRAMSHASLDNNTYGKLSDCHSPLTPVGNSSVKAPRRIEPAYSQFPTHQPEPVYANTQSLYDNILYPDASVGSKAVNRSEKKSCASQTQLTWTMATFSSFVDLENQGVIIQQPDPTTLYSVVRHPQMEPPPSASPATVEHMRRMSPNLQYIDDTVSPSHQQRSRTPTTSRMVMIEKRDGSFQTLLSIAPTENVDAHKARAHPDSSPSPLSTGSSSTTDGQHAHSHSHRHRRHKSRSNTSRNNISTRDVGLQVNIQTVKKITFSTQRTDDSSMTTSTSSPPTVRTPRELRHAQTNTDTPVDTHDRSTSYETSLHLLSSAAQTPVKSLRDQSTETQQRGLFVCDLSSFLKNGTEETSAAQTPKRKL